jgi:hypothetical protein
MSTTSCSKGCCSCSDSFVFRLDFFRMGGDMADQAGPGFACAADGARFRFFFFFADVSVGLSSRADVDFLPMGAL